MCNEICYLIDQKLVITHFTNPIAKLPVKTKFGTTQLIKWGRRKNENGKLPLGGWANLASIENGRWDPYFPKFAKLAITKFSESDHEGHGEWFDITAGFYIQGLFVQHGQEQRVYIVTLAPELPESLYPRWPRILAD